MATPRATNRALPDRISLWLAAHLRGVLGAAAIACAALFATWISVGSLPLDRLREDAVQWLGGGAYLIALALAAAGVLGGAQRARAAIRADRTLMRRVISIALTLLALWGVAGAVVLNESLGDVSLSQYGAGGRVGGWFDSTLGWASIVAGFLAAIALIAPHLSKKLLHSATQAATHGGRWLGRQIREQGPPAMTSAGRGLRNGLAWLLRHMWLLVRWIGRESRDAIMALRQRDAKAHADQPVTKQSGQSREPRSAEPRQPTPGAAQPTQFEAAWPPMSEAKQPITPTERSAATAQPTTKPPAQPPSTLRSLDRIASDGWRLPPIELLDQDQTTTLRSGAEEQAEVIVETLASFGVDARVTQINEGPAITQFGVEPGWEIKTRQVPRKDESGRPVLDERKRPVMQSEEVSRTRVRVNRITRLADDLALALAAPSIRIEAPVPGQPIVGVEVPNADRRIVTLRGLIESNDFAETAKQEGLPIALGRNVRGNPVIADLTRMPHVLIAGATGSGKSVCINTIITSLLMQKSPEEVRLILVDPKRVELTGYGVAPHLAFSHVVTEPDEVVSVLGVVVAEMDRRYRMLEDHKARNIIAYNALEHVQKRMPYWVVVLDELADMMMAAAAEVEGQLVRLAQLARAVGIHLVVATQRPSVDVVTGLIKANFPTRIAFATTSQTDARVIMDRAGAEKLMGRGDMLYMSSDTIKPRRVQGAFVSDAEIERILSAWMEPQQTDTDRSSLDEMLERLLEESPAARSETEARAAQADLRTLTTTLETALAADPLNEATDKPDDEPDIVTEPASAAVAEPLDSRLGEAIELARGYEHVSAMLLQRRMRIGRPRADRLIEQLEQTGVIEASDDGRSRRVLTRSD